MRKYWIYFIGLLSWGLIESSEPHFLQPKKKQYTLSICAVFKNERKFLKEWIEYHRMIGVDHFYLYNNNSIDRPIEVLRPYIKKNIVTLINWPDFLKESQIKEKSFVWTLGVQIPAYQNAAKITAKDETEWLTFLDVDEFLVPVGHNHLTEILDECKSEAGILLEEEFYDASPAKTFPPRKLVIQSVSMTQEIEKKPDAKIEKFIFKPQKCDVFSFAPFCSVFENKQKPVSISRQILRVNRYQYRDQKYYDSRLLKEKIKVDNTRFETDAKNLLQCGYEIDDQERAIFRFVPSVLKKMEE